MLPVSSRLWPLLGLLAGCDAVFGPADGSIVVPIERAAEAAPRTARDAGPPADAREVAERVWALLQLAQLDDAEGQCAAAEARPPTGTVRQRALLEYRCGRVAEARRDDATRERRLAAAFALFASPRIARAMGPDPARVPLPEATLAAVHARLQALGAAHGDLFELVDGPVAVGPHRVASLEHCARPSEVCQGALVLLGADGRPLDVLVVPYGAAPGTLEALAIPGARASLVAMRGDLPAELRVGLYVAARLDAGRITPVALVHATRARPDRAEKVRLQGDALVIDETPAPWDARLRLFRGAPVAATSE